MPSTDRDTLPGQLDIEEEVIRKQNEEKSSTLDVQTLTNDISNLIREPLPKGRISTADIAVGFLSSTDVNAIAYKIAKYIEENYKK